MNVRLLRWFLSRAFVVVIDGLSLPNIKNRSAE